MTTYISLHEVTEVKEHVNTLSGGITVKTLTVLTKHNGKIEIDLFFEKGE